VVYTSSSVQVPSSRREIFKAFVSNDIQLQANNKSTHADQDRPFTSWIVALASFRFYPKLLWPTALGIAAACATILGALLVGDSLRGSLKFIALDRVGRIEQIVLAPNFFNADVVAKLNPSKIDKSLDQALPAIVFRGTSLEVKANDAARRTSGVLTLGITPDFWSMEQSRPSLREDSRPTLGDEEIIVNEALANDLQLKVDDRVVLQIPAPSAVPADNPLGKRDSESVSIANLKVVAILPNEGLARLDLQSNQRSSLNAFITPATIQRALSRPNQFNAIVVSRNNQVNPEVVNLNEAESSSANLLKELDLSLTDLGMHFDEINFTSQPHSTHYFQLTSDRLIVPNAVVESIASKLVANQYSTLMTYLANGIQSQASPNKPIIPYSTIAGIDPSMIGPDKEAWQLPTDGLSDGFKLGVDDCLINSWLAEQGQINIGDELKIDYFQSENEDGREVERSFNLKVVGIVPLTEPARGYRRSTPAVFETPPTVFNDPNMTPTVAGITDQDSISDWETPFELTREISKADDDYWKNHRLTPKVIMHLEKAQSLFGSRFGKVSSLRFATTTVSDSAVDVRSSVEASVREAATDLGWQVIPLRAQQVAAASGTTPFDGLFLSLSFFVIAAALMLIFLLVRLAVENRSTQWGILKATGWNAKQIRRLIVSEFMPVIVIGCLIGIPIGFMFCKAILAMLSGRWVGAIGIAFIDFHWTLRSILIGALVSAVCAWLTVRVSLRYLSSHSVIGLLRTNIASQNSVSLISRRRFQNWAWVVCFAIALLLPIVAAQLQGPAKAGAYLGSGFLVLVGMLLLYRTRLLEPIQQNSNQKAIGLKQLALSSLGRNRLRSMLAVGLVAMATFLLLSVSLFHVVPDSRGTGEFVLMGRSDLPIARDLNDPKVRRDALGSSSDALDDAKFISMRLRGGDDAGCNNLYQANQPQVLGVPTSMKSIDVVSDTSSIQSKFAWAATAISGNQSSPWAALEVLADGSADSPIPVIIDQNTAMWGLHLISGIGEVFSYEYDGKRIHFETVGLLQNTILQGYLMIGETNFKQQFPDIGGSRFFLVNSTASTQLTQELIERGWSNEGMDLSQSADVLRQLLSVQNTYLSAFQSLGMLGLLLGTLGLAVIQIRSVMERRSEFAVMRAVGFNSQRIVRTLITEHFVLLTSGLVIGLLAALVAVAFAVFSGQSIGSLTMPAMMLGLVFVIGTLAGIIAVRRAIRVPVLEALRSQT
jgi:putative ABC transport system permease protein